MASRMADIVVYIVNSRMFTSAKKSTLATPCTTKLYHIHFVDLVIQHIFHIYAFIYISL